MVSWLLFSPIYVVIAIVVALARKGNSKKFRKTLRAIVEKAIKKRRLRAITLKAILR